MSSIDASWHIPQITRYAALQPLRRSVPIHTYKKSEGQVWTLNIVKHDISDVKQHDHLSTAWVQLTHVTSWTSFTAWLAKPNCGLHQ